MDHTTKDPTIRALKQASLARATEADRHPPGAPDDGADERDLLRPFDDAERARLFAGVSAEVTRQARRRRVTRLASIAAPIFAMAAAAMLIFRGLPEGTRYYDFDLARGSAETEAVTLDADGRFTRRLTRWPGVDRKDGFELQTLCTQNDRSLPCPVHHDELSPRGDITIQGARETMFPADVREGQWDLCIFIARRGRMPPAADLREAGCAHPGPRLGYQALRLPIVLKRKP